jgi:regulator of sigma E protease
LFFDAGFSLFKFKKGDTEYVVGWLPLGGYVKIAGMIDESMDTEHLSKPPEDWEFRSKPAWQRLIVMAGGVVVNFVLAFVLYVMILFVWGEDYISNESLPEGFAVHEEFQQYGFRDGDHILSVDGEDLLSALDINKHLFIRGARVIEVAHKDGTQETIMLPEGTDQMMFQKNVMRPFFPQIKSAIDSVYSNSLGEKAGIQKGDSIIAINGKVINYWHEVSEMVRPLKNQKIKIDFVRGGIEKSVDIQLDSVGVVGVDVFMIEDITIENKSYSLGESIPAGLDMAVWTLKDYMAQFKFIFTKKGSTAVGGFASVGKLFPAEWRWESFWSITAFLSIMLAFINLLPIPMLDGGHITFLLYEIIAGRPPSDKFLTNAQMVGLVIVLGLFLYSNGLDILKGLGVIANN